MKIKNARGKCKTHSQDASECGHCNRSHLASDYLFGILPHYNKIHLVLNYERIP